MSYDFVSNGMTSEETEGKKEVVSADELIAELKELEEEPDPAQATEKEEADFKAYQRRITQQKPIIDSYEKMLEAKEIEEKKKEIDKLNRLVGTRVMNLHAQKGGMDRLKLDMDFYQQVWEGVKSDVLFNGDIRKQYRLLELLVGQEFQIKKAVEVRQLLIDEFPELFS